jgi:ATP-dependent protease ClpP protease subunit
LSRPIATGILVNLSAVHHGYVREHANEWGFLELQYRERIIFLGQYIDEEFGNQVVATMLYLDSIENTKPMFLYINSPGGDVSATALFQSMVDPLIQ